MKWELKGICQNVENQYTFSYNQKCTNTALSRENGRHFQHNFSLLFRGLGELVHSFFFYNAQSVINDMF